MFSHGLGRIDPFRKFSTNGRYFSRADIISAEWRVAIAPTPDARRMPESGRSLRTGSRRNSRADIFFVGMRIVRRYGRYVHEKGTMI
jgi:hypothetical protein